MALFFGNWCSHVFRIQSKQVNIDILQTAIHNLTFLVLILNSKNPLFLRAFSNVNRYHFVNICLTKYVIFGIWGWPLNTIDVWILQWWKK